MYSFIKNFVKEWVWWGWVLFISLLASQGEPHPPISPSVDPTDHDAFTEFCLKTQEKLKEEEKNKGKKSPRKTKAATTTVRTLGRLKPNQKKEASVEQTVKTEQELNDEPKEDEEEVWFGGGQKLTRYPGLQNLVLNDESLADKSNISVPQERKNLVEEITPLHKPLDETEKLWEELVAQYAAEDSTKGKIKILERHEPVYKMPEVKGRSRTPDLMEERLHQYLSRIDDTDLSEDQAVEDVSEDQAVADVSEDQAVEDVSEDQAVEDVSEDQAVEDVSEDQAVEDVSEGEARDLEEEISNSINIKQLDDNENKIFIMIEDDELVEDMIETQEPTKPDLDTISEDENEVSETEIEKLTNTEIEKSPDPKIMKTPELEVEESVHEAEMSETHAINNFSKPEDEENAEPKIDRPHKSVIEECGAPEIEISSDDKIENAQNIAAMVNEGINLETPDENHEILSEDTQNGSLKDSDLDKSKCVTTELVTDTHILELQETTVSDHTKEEGGKVEVIEINEENVREDLAHSLPSQGEENESFENNDNLVDKIPTSDALHGVQSKDEIELDSPDKIDVDPFTTTYEEFIEECEIAADGLEEQDVEDLLDISESHDSDIDDSKVPATPLLDFNDAGEGEYINVVHEELQEQEGVSTEVAREIIVVKGIYTPSELSAEENQRNFDLESISVGDENERCHSTSSYTKETDDYPANVDDEVDINPEDGNILRLKAIGLTDSESEFVSKIVAKENARTSCSYKQDSFEDSSEKDLETNRVDKDISKDKYESLEEMEHTSFKPETIEERLFSETIIVNRRLEDLTTDSFQQVPDYSAQLYLDTPLDNSLLSDNQWEDTNRNEKLDISVSMKLLPDIPEEGEQEEMDLSDDMKYDDEGSEGVCVDSLSEEETDFKKTSEIEKDYKDDPSKITDIQDQRDDIPGYLDDVKDLLVPRARRKKPKRRFTELDNILKVEPETEKRVKVKVEDVKKETDGLDVGMLLETSFTTTETKTPEEAEIPASKVSEDHPGLTEELEAIQKEHEEVRAAQRKELEKYLSMPYALTEQEQVELEEFLAEEECNKNLTAASEARLAAFLAEVRARLGQDEPEEDLEHYMELPPELTEDEEYLLSGGEVEKERGDFETDEEYKDYVKKRYLQRLEDERQRVLEEEEYDIDDGYDYEYEYDEDYSYDGESADGSYGMVDEEGGQLIPSKDQAVGPDVPMSGEGAKHKGKRMKKNWSLSSLRSKDSPRGSKASLDSKDSSKEGSIGEESRNAKNSQTTFFRYGSLGPKRKKVEEPHTTLAGEKIPSNSCQYEVKTSETLSNEETPDIVHAYKTIQLKYHPDAGNLSDAAQDRETPDQKLGSDDIHTETTGFVETSSFLGGDSDTCLTNSISDEKDEESVESTINEHQPTQIIPILSEDYSGHQISPRLIPCLPLKSIENTIDKTDASKMNDNGETRIYDIDDATNPLQNIGHGMPVYPDTAPTEGCTSTKMGDFRSSLSSRKVVSALDDDSLEYLTSVSPTAASNTSFEQSTTLQSPSPSLQELIEAELSARLVPLQPDSLEEVGGGDPPEEVMDTEDHHERTHVLVTGNHEVTSTCITTLDSLETSPFSLDSLADGESGVDLSSPVNVKPPSDSTTPSASSPTTSHSDKPDTIITPTTTITCTLPLNSETLIINDLVKIVPDPDSHCDDNTVVCSVQSSSTLDLNNPCPPEIVFQLVEPIVETLTEIVENKERSLENEICPVKSMKEDEKVIDLCHFDDGKSNSTSSFEVHDLQGSEIQVQELDVAIIAPTEASICNELPEHSELKCSHSTMVEQPSLENESQDKCATGDMLIQDDLMIREVSDTLCNSNGNVISMSESLETSETIANGQINGQSKEADPVECQNPLEKKISFEVSSIETPLTNGNHYETACPPEPEMELEICQANLINGSEKESQVFLTELNGKATDHELVNQESLVVSKHISNSLVDETSPSHSVDVINKSNIEIISSSQVQIVKSSTIHSSVDVTNVKRVTKTTTTNTAKTKEEAWPDEMPKSPPLDEFEKMEKEVMLQMEKEAKETEINGDKKNKKDSTEKKKKKKKKKADSEKENKKNSYQNRDDLLQKHVGPRIRSFDPAKMKSKFNKPKENTQVPTECRICGKPVFQMEKIFAEKASWHKNCFRCKECSKQLTLETYQSHERSLYCKPHFKELFRPKAVVQDEAEERKDRLLRRPKMIILESQPEQLPDDVVRSTAKPDYGLEELQALNMRQRFSMFENASKETEDQPKLEPASVRRSRSLMSKAKRFFGGEKMDGEMNGEDEEEEVEEDEEEEEEEEEENETGIVRANRKKKERPMSFSGMGDLKNAWEQKNRREELTHARKEEISRFRQMLCAGKNMSLKDKFESGNVNQNEDEEGNQRVKPREFLKMDNIRAKSLKERFEKGEPFIPEDEDSEEEEDSEEGEAEKVTRREKRDKRRSCIIGEKAEVEEIFKDAETAKKARNVFKQIDSKMYEQGNGNAVLRSQSFSQAHKDNRFSQDMSHLSLKKNSSTAEVVKANEKLDDFHVDTTDLASRFKFFSNFEERQGEEKEKKRKVFRITPPREGVDDQGLRVEDVEVGRDPNLIKCTDNYQDEFDCHNTKNLLQMFKKLEMGPESDEEEDGPRPLKRFTPPPEDYEDESEYTDEEYTDEEDEDDDEEEVDENGVKRPKYRDELLEMASSQSARKAANLRAKFEKWEAEVERRNEINKNYVDEDEECMPSLDTAKNLRAMFENKASEEPKPTLQRPQKVNRFV